MRPGVLRLSEGQAGSAAEGRVTKGLAGGIIICSYFQKSRIVMPQDVGIVLPINTHTKAGRGCGRRLVGENVIKFAFEDV